MKPLNANELKAVTVAEVIDADDIEREVYGIFGVPVDAIDMANTLERITAAAVGRKPLLISTINLNFLLSSQTDERFHESILRSDLCTADGMPILWIARLLGIPINTRIAGSDVFEALKVRQHQTRRLNLFLFGGANGVAAAAREKLNAEHGPLFCVGWHDPGFVSVDDMSTDAILSAINSSNADFLALALGAKKGQEWLLRNHDRVQIPVRVHLGATINFQAGTLTRAPKFMQKSGLEWLWRIMQEPKLWKGRYRDDGFSLLRLLLTRVIPLRALERWHRMRSPRQDLVVTSSENREGIVLGLYGSAIADNLEIALPYFRRAIAARMPITIDLTDTRRVDARFFGLLLMLDKVLKRQRLNLAFTGASSRIEQVFRLSGFSFLLHPKTEGRA
jgi:N-acetylglucosaminyldiphosphoundecaprenol N-acetyl-beta-D-mannosaminyltransferase